VINARADDGPLPARFHDVLGVGYLRPIPAYGTSKRAVSWRVGRLAELRLLVEALDAFPPRGRVADVYDAWRELVLLEPRPRDVRASIAAEVRRRRAYQPGRETFAPSSADERRRQRCLDALKAWAASRDGPGSASDYAGWRRASAPDTPTRNTIAAAFGSWRGALEAAGLSLDRACSVEKIDALRAAHARRREAHRPAQRTAVIRAVRSCIADLGREPRAREFLAWRKDHLRACLSQATIYRAFPGGFAELIEAARGQSEDFASARQLRIQLDRLHGRQGLRYRAAFLRRLGGLLEV
jgi:hypothetical protein